MALTKVTKEMADVDLASTAYVDAAVAAIGSGGGSFYRWVVVEFNV